MSFETSLKTLEHQATAQRQQPSQALLDEVYKINCSIDAAPATHMAFPDCSEGPEANEQAEVHPEAKQDKSRSSDLQNNRDGGSCSRKFDLNQPKGIKNSEISHLPKLDLYNPQKLKGIVYNPSDFIL